MIDTPIPVCWSRAEIQVATQVDVGGLEFGNPAADAMFNAVHQAVPMGRLDKTNRDDLERVDQADVLDDLCQPIASNEPHLRFITGKAGSGKSHLVRWLSTQIPKNPDWHVVYIEKRNTSLRRVIEQILAGIDTPAATELLSSLAKTAARLPTVQEAMLALLNQLHQIIEYDDTPVIDDMSGADLERVRRDAARLIGELPFKQRLSAPGGPIERITKLAMSGIDPDSDISEDDLQISAGDLEVGLESFRDSNSSKELQLLVRGLISNLSRRRATASIINYHLARAKAEIFTGRSSDLLSVFEEVRQELARQGKELFLFIEDLVLLHGIDTQLAQALTLPARSDLCPIRAVIAVTSGHLERYTTFAERGVQYTMDVDRSSLQVDDLRAFVGRYLNAGRVGRKDLAAAAASGKEIPNPCPKCVHVDRCHAAFGATSEGHGLFPFNANAVDNLIELASPQGFDPRNILRQVIRSPLEVAEDELPRRSFPSARFAATLAPTRLPVPVELRYAITSNSSQADQEISLRAFYARNPPSLDTALLAVAETLGVQLTELGGDAAPEPHSVPPRTQRGRPNEIDQWVDGTHLRGQTALAIRRWIIQAVGARLQVGPHGLNVRALGNEIQVGPVKITFTNIVIPTAAGGGGASTSGPSLVFEQNAADATLFKGILAASEGNLAGPDGGAWFLRMQERLAEFEEVVVAAAQGHVDRGLVEALNTLGVLSTVDDRDAATPAEALAVIVQPKQPADLHPRISRLLQDSDSLRTQALAVLRDRLTQRKGNGAPSVFDAAPVLDMLLPAIRLRELSPTAGEHTAFETSMRTFRDRHQAQSSQAWDSVRETLDKLRHHIADDEDFATTAAEVDKFVDHASKAGVLSQREGKVRYDELRGKASPEAFKNHRRLLRLAAARPGPAQLWDLRRDPSADLNALLDYWRLCDQLLAAYRPDTGSHPTSGEVYDRERLQTALKSLADSLEA